MKKIIIVLALLLMAPIRSNLDSPVERIEVPKKTIAENLRQAIDKSGRRWSSRSFERTVSALHRAEVVYGIDHRIIITLGRVESDMSVWATGNNRNGTRDYGWLQVNDCNMEEFQRAASEIESDPENKYDPATAVIAAASYLAWSRRELVKRNQYSISRLIMSYNCGLNGSDHENPRYAHLAEKRSRYWTKFCTKSMEEI